MTSGCEMRKPGLVGTYVLVHVMNTYDPNGVKCRLIADIIGRGRGVIVRPNL